MRSTVRRRSRCAPARVRRDRRRAARRRAAAARPRAPARRRGLGMSPRRDALGARRRRSSTSRPVAEYHPRRRASGATPGPPAAAARRCSSSRSSSSSRSWQSAAPSPARLRSARAATSPRCARSRSARTRSSTPPTARCSGSIPAERNRQPVALRTMSTWLAEGDDRDRGPPLLRARRRRLRRASRARCGRTSRPARSSQGGSTITQQLVRNLYPVSRERTLDRKIKEACLAIKLNRAAHEGLDPRRVHEPGLLRQPRVRRRGGRADVLLQARAQSHARRGGDPRRPAAGAVELRPVPAPERRRSRAATPCCAAMLRRTAITTARVRASRSRRRSGSRPGRLYTRIREPYFFSYVREELIKEYGATTVRSGGLKVYTTIDRRFQRHREARR